MAQHERAHFLALEAENAAIARTLDQIRKELTSPRSNALPRFAGAAAVAACLTRRVSATWAAMQVRVASNKPVLFFSFSKGRAPQKPLHQ